MPEVQVNNTSTAPSREDAGKASSGSSASDPGPAKKKTSKRKLSMYILLFLAAAGTGLYFCLHPGSSAGAAAHAEAENTLALDTFVVNLNGAGQRAYLRIGITLGMAHGQPRKKDDVPIAPLRDAIVSVLSSAQAEQLLAADGKQKLKADLLKALQQRAPDFGIESVYFTEFLVQM